MDLTSRKALANIRKWEEQTGLQAAVSEVSCVTEGHCMSNKSECQQKQGYVELNRKGHRTGQARGTQIPGLCPWFGLSHSDLLGQSPHQGQSPILKKRSLRRGRATTSHPAAKPNLTWPTTFEAKPSVIKEGVPLTFPCDQSRDWCKPTVILIRNL
jgi:hypothetical protein